MDRLAAIARLVGAMVFTGSGRHFVKYRDAQAPFGYDISELLPEPGDVALYHDRFAQPYRHDKVIALRDLLLRLAPVALHRAPLPRRPGTLYALLRPGPRRLRRRLPRPVERPGPRRHGRVGSAAARATSSSGRAAPAHQPAPRFVQLLRSLPGVKALRARRRALPRWSSATATRSRSRPARRSSAARSSLLFRAGGGGAIALAQRPPFVDVQAVTLARQPTQPATVRA
jgi:hypothetical protein